MDKYLIIPFQKFTYSMAVLILGLNNEKNGQVSHINTTLNSCRSAH